jgi:FAD/FMN-containing dehydrogenase
MNERAGVLSELDAVVGEENLLTDISDRRFYSMDCFNEAKEPVVAVVRPETVDELANVVRICASRSIPMVARGGGASYTDGFVPARSGTVCIDTLRLASIDINEGDMCVTVGPGVTWCDLYEALKQRGLRTPMWGPFSGIAATVGGGMSHYAVNYGSGVYGVSAESLISMDVVIADGSVLSTGSAGGEGASPFFRYYGPDLAGLFVGDAGAFGIKASITLRLMRKPDGFAAASFGFRNGDDMLDAMTGIARLGLVSQNFGLDPRQQKTALTEMESTKPLDAARSVLRSSRNPLDGVLQVMRMGFAGRGFLKNAAYSAHFSTEGHSVAEARAKLAPVRALARKYGREVANSIPTFFNAAPFMPLTPILGPEGERWKPTHGIIPFSNVKQHHADIQALIAEKSAEMDRLGVQLTRMFMFFSTNGFIYEPTFLWRDARTEYHRRMMPQKKLTQLPEHAPNPEGRLLVEEIKKRIQEICLRNGAGHFQIGKDYPYLATRKQPVADFVIALKRLLDPDNLMNPGALGIPPDPP